MPRKASTRSRPRRASGPSTAERLTALEIRQEQSERTYADLLARLDALAAEIKKHTSELTKYRGVWLGVMLAASAIVTVWGVIRELIPFIAGLFR